MKLASFEIISEIKQHPNADRLEIAKVLGYECIVPKENFRIGQLAVFISPDTVLPDQPWAEPYKKFCKARVKAIKLRGSWSYGIVESIENLKVPAEINSETLAEYLGVTKYEPPVPQSLDAKGGLPYSIPKTDEERWQSLEQVPFGEQVDVTLKIDGSSCSFYCKKEDDGSWSTGVMGRSLEYKIDKPNNYTKLFHDLKIADKLKAFCQTHDVSLCVRGEMHGAGIQKGAHNPHAKLSLSWAMFSVYLIDKMKYARKGDPFYFVNLAKVTGLPCVPVLETDVLSEVLIKKYDESEDFGHEGVVVNGKDFSFKIVNKHYDSKK